MKVNFVDLRAQYLSIKPEMDAAIAGILESCAFVNSRSFEKDFATYLGVKNVVGVGNGTDALCMAVHCLGIGPGDEVICPANTFIATAEGIGWAGATPVFVDCDPVTYNLDPTKIEAAITPRTRAITAVHLYGQPADMDPIMVIAKEHGLLVIEDCAQSHAATYKGRKAGTFGDVACFSFYPGKNLGAYGDGGAIVTDDDDFARQARLFASHGSLLKHIHEIEGINSRLDAIQAAVLKVKLGHIDDWNRARNSHALKYNEVLSGIAQIKTPKLRPDAFHIFHLYVIRAERRDDLAAFLKDKGVFTGIHYAKALPLMPAYRYLNQKPADFPVAYECQDQILSLPMYPELADDQIAYVAESIREFYKK